MCYIFPFRRYFMNFALPLQLLHAHPVAVIGTIAATTFLGYWPKKIENCPAGIALVASKVLPLIALLYHGAPAGIAAYLAGRVVLSTITNATASMNRFSALLRALGENLTLWLLLSPIIL